MLVLFETPAGYAIFKVLPFVSLYRIHLTSITLHVCDLTSRTVIRVTHLNSKLQLLDESKLTEADNLFQDFETAENASKM